MDKKLSKRILIGNIGSYCVGAAYMTAVRFIPFPFSLICGVLSGGFVAAIGWWVLKGYYNPN